MDLFRKLFTAVVVCSIVTTATEDSCKEYSKHIHHHNPTVSYDEPSPLGLWVSSRCEIIPGPRYITRRLNIQLPSWYGHIYHYEDSWCTKPSFTVKVAGTYEMYSATATPQAKTSQACDFSFDQVSFTTRNVSVLRKTLDMIEENCIEAMPLLKKVDRENNIENFVNRKIKLQRQVLSKKDCRYYFALHYNSYKKILMVGQKKRSDNRKDILYFADIPPRDQVNEKSVGSGFQYGLSRGDRPDCRVCSLVAKSNIPVLPVSLKTQNFIGGWVSHICETSTDNTFKSRYFDFAPPKNGEPLGDVTLYVNMFTDPNCKNKMLSLKTTGSVRDIAMHEIVDGVLEIEVFLRKLYLTGYNDPTLGMMRQPGTSCGDRKKWRYGVEQDVTKTRGCSNLGLSVPKRSFMFIRVANREGKRELYIHDSDKGDGTFFNDNLVLCHRVAKNLTRRIVPPESTNHFEPIPNDDDYETAFFDPTKSGSTRSLISLVVCIASVTLHFSLLIYL